MTPIHGPSPTAQPWQELIVTVGLLSLTLAMIAGTLLVLLGYIQKRGEN